MTTTRTVTLTITDEDDFQGGYPAEWDWSALVEAPLGVTVAVEDKPE